MQPTGETKVLNTSRGEYTDYVYKNQYSAVAEGRELTGVKTYDGYYLSFAEGYLCDEINHYSTLAYGNEAQYITRGDDHSNDAVLKSGFELRKVVSTNGPGSPAPQIGGRGLYGLPCVGVVQSRPVHPQPGRNLQCAIHPGRLPQGQLR